MLKQWLLSPFSDYDLYDFTVGYAAVLFSPFVIPAVLLLGYITRIGGIRALADGGGVNIDPIETLKLGVTSLVVIFVYSSIILLTPMLASSFILNELLQHGFIQGSGRFLTVYVFIFSLVAIFSLQVSLLFICAMGVTKSLATTLDPRFAISVLRSKQVIHSLIAGWLTTLGIFTVLLTVMLFTGGLATIFLPGVIFWSLLVGVNFYGTQLSKLSEVSLPQDPVTEIKGLIEYLTSKYR